MNYLKPYSFGLITIACRTTQPAQRSLINQHPAHTDKVLPPDFSTGLTGSQKIFFATSKYDNSLYRMYSAIVGFTRFNGKPLTFSSSTTTDGMAS